MDDLRDRFRLVDRLEPPPMWKAAEAKAKAPPPPMPMPPGTSRPWRRLAVAAAALAIAAAGFAVAVRELRTTRGPQPGGSPGEIDSLRAVTFVDSSHGWAAGEGAIIATSDGGSSWTRQYSGPAGIVSLDFVDPSHGWAVALSDGLFRTADGGATWTEAGEPGGGLFLESVDFVSPTEGWGIALRSEGGAAGQGELMRTTDGGETWTTVQPGIDSVCVAGSVMYVGVGSKVLRSTDGGSMWTAILNARSTTTQWFGADVQCPDASSIWVLFTDGVAAGSQAYAAYRSADGGATWAPVVVAPLVAGSDPAFRGVAQLDAYPGPFAAVSGSEAVFLGSCPACDPQHVAVLRTQDGGATWVRQVIDGHVPTAVSFAGADHGWMTTGLGFPGRGAAILATTDGGKTWRVVFPQGLQTPTPSPTSAASLSGPPQAGEIVGSIPFSPARTELFAARSLLVVRPRDPAGGRTSITVMRVEQDGTVASQKVPFDLGDYLMNVSAGPDGVYAGTAVVKRFIDTPDELVRIDSNTLQIETRATFAASVAAIQEGQDLWASIGDGLIARVRDFIARFESWDRHDEKEQPRRMG